MCRSGSCIAWSFSFPAHIQLVLHQSIQSASLNPSCFCTTVLLQCCTKTPENCIVASDKNYERETKHATKNGNLDRNFFYSRDFYNEHLQGLIGQDVKRHKKGTLDGTTVHRRGNRIYSCQNSVRPRARMSAQLAPRCHWGASLHPALPLALLLQGKNKQVHDFQDQNSNDNVARGM